MRLGLSLLLLAGLAGCQPPRAESETYELLFCADGAVYSALLASNNGVTLNKLLDLPPDSTCPIWSRDGKLALLYRFKQAGLTVEDSLSLIERQSGIIKEVYHFEPRDAEWTIRWLPDGISFLIASARDYHGVEGCSKLFTQRSFNGTDCWSGYADLYSMDVRLQDAPDHFERLTDSPSPRCDLTWSSDGRKVVYSRGDICKEGVGNSSSIEILSRETSVTLPLVDGTSGTADPSAVNLNSAPQWSPNGEEVSFTRFQSASGSPPTHQLLIANVASSGTHPISPDAVYGYWSPDGKKIVWWRDNFETLGVTDLESSDTQTWSLSKDRVYIMSPLGWSPNGQYFAWTERGEGGNEKAVRILDLASANLTTLSTSFAHSVAWSWDSNWLAFSVRTPIEPNTCKHRIEIYIVKPDGTGLRNVTDGQQRSALPCGPTGWGWKWYQDTISDVQWVSR